MKAILSFFFALLLLVSCSHRESKPSASSATARNGHLSYLFSHDSVDVYYGDRLMKVVDTASFRVLSDGYAVDDSTGYYQGEKFETAFPPTLIVLGGGYAKDKYEAYYRGKAIATAQSSSMTWVAGDTAKDAFDTYIQGLQQYKNNQ